jgi:hypothetical protein
MRAAEAWSMHPARIAELFMPGWFGRPFDVEHYPGGAFADDPAVQALPWAVSMYAGAAVLMFVPFARGRRALAALGGTAALFLLLALGRHTPLNGWMRWIVPGLSLLRYPEKHAVVVMGLLGLLAARGLERVLAERIAAFRLAPGAFAAIALATLLAPAPLRAAAHAGALHVAVATALLALGAHLAHRMPAMAWTVPLVAVLDLSLAARPFLRWAAGPVFESPFPAALADRSYQAPPRLYRPRAGDFETASTLPDGAAQVFRLAATPGHDPAHSIRLELLMKALEHAPERLAELLALDALLLPSTAPMQIPARLSAAGWSLYVLPPAPRAWVVGSVRLDPADAALRRLASDSFDPYAEAIVSARDPREVRGIASAPAGKAGDCAIAEYRRASIDLVCDARTSGLVVVSELDADGWHASVDGEERRLYTTDLVLRGIPIPAGRHRVALRYETPGLIEGSLVALLSVLSLALAWVMSFRRERSRSAALIEESRPSARRSAS